MLKKIFQTSAVVLGLFTVSMGANVKAKAQNCACLKKCYYENSNGCSSPGKSHSEGNCICERAYIICLESCFEECSQTR